MGNNRKLPFGYKMEFGRVVINPDEKTWVEYIFRQYVSGASFKELSEYMAQEGIPYESGKSWNKNMIARIIGDSRYIGQRDYPAIIDVNTFERAAGHRNTKKVPVQKTDAQKMLRRKCGFKVTPYIENEVLYLLNRLVEDPEQIATPKDIRTKSDRLEILKSELEDLLVKLPVDEDRTREKLMEIAVVMYEVVDPREYETYRMKRVFRAEIPRKELDASLIAMNISAVLVDSDGNVQIKLKNEQVIERGE
jgi:hypothetical protein